MTEIEYVKYYAAIERKRASNAIKDLRGLEARISCAMHYYAPFITSRMGHRGLGLTMAVNRSHARPLQSKQLRHLKRRRG